MFGVYKREICVIESKAVFLSNRIGIGRRNATMTLEEKKEIF